MQTKVVNNIEYLDYEQAAREYGYKVSSISTMISRGCFESIKFPHNSKRYIARIQLEAYKTRKEDGSNLSVNSQAPRVESEVPQGTNFTLESLQQLAREVCLTGRKAILIL